MFVENNALNPLHLLPVAERDYLTLAVLWGPQYGEQVEIFKKNEWSLINGVLKDCGIRRKILRIMPSPPPF